MILFLHGFLSNGFCLFLNVGWVISTYLVFRGSMIFVKSENKNKLLIIASILLLVCGLMNLLLYTLDKEVFAFTEGVGVFAFPFGVFSGVPLLIITSMIYENDMMTNQILLFCLSILNLVALIDFADMIERKIFYK